MGEARGGDSLHERIALDGPRDEIKDLADTFDAMLERLDRSFDSQRRFVANASHELHTPLTINRSLIEVALDDPQASESLRQLGGTLLAVNERHERLIDGLLTLASSEQGITDPNVVDLADVARHITTESQVAANIAGVQIRTNLQPAPVTGDSILLERLTQNLLDNAIRYNLPELGEITVTTDTVDDHAHLTVENTGPPVPPYEVRHAQRILKIPEVAHLYQMHFPVVLVDEVQDLTPQQLDIVLAVGGTAITAAADPAQGIYSFAGANLEHVLSTLRDRQPAEVEFNLCYRSAPAVLEVVNALAEVQGATRLECANPDTWPELGRVAMLRRRTLQEEASALLDAIAELQLASPNYSIGVVARRRSRREEAEREARDMLTRS